MNAISTCPGCRKPLSTDAPKGLCQECLLKAGFPSGTQTEGGESHNRFVPPGIEELGLNFPQLEILELIGQGGMGAVYKARQKQLGRIVALKILPPGAGDQSAFSARFTREARALASLNHPGIVTLFEFGQADGLFYFLMELVDGVNIRQLLSAGRISPREALAIVPQICDALQYAHDHGIVHRDIKPENILLDRKGRVKVADFGLARLMVTQAETSQAGETSLVSVSLTDAGKIMGTPRYMAPEQVERPNEVDHRADIYSLGVVFYQMLTGELPGKRIEPPSRKVHLDVRLDKVVLRALEQEPERRYQAASGLKTEVENIAEGPSTASSRANSGYVPLGEMLFGRGWICETKFGWVRFWEKLFGAVTSSGAVVGLNLSLLGFLGFAAALAILPGMRWCLPAFGFFGMFGLIGVAYIFESAARSGANLSEKSQNPSLEFKKSAWRKRIFWLIAAGIIAPILFFGFAVAVIGARGDEVALERATPRQMILLFAVVFGIGFGLSIIIWTLLRAFRRRFANDWPRRVELLVALTMLWPILVCASSIVIWKFTADARVSRAGTMGGNWLAFSLPTLIGVAGITWILRDVVRLLRQAKEQCNHPN